MRHANRADHNQPEIVRAIKDMKGVWHQCQPPFPCDGILFVGVTAIFVEIKNGKLPPSGRKLTENEEAFRVLCETHSVPWELVESVDDVVKIINCNRKKRV